MRPDDPEDCPTFTCRPPPPSAGAPARPDEPASSSNAPAGDDDDGPITDVDDGPPTFSIGPGGTRGSSPPPGGFTTALPDEVTLVNAAPPYQRLTARVVTADATHLFVAVDGEPAARRISRVACFEHPVGGGWSTWRLSGADRERWHVAGPMPSSRPKPGDASA